MVQDRDDIVGLDAGILMHPQVWVTSGHVGSFSDPLVECATCHRRYRLDELPGAEELTVTDLADPDVIARFHLDLPQRRRPALAAAPVQPDVPELHGPGPGRRLDRLLPARDRPGLVRQLQERPRVEPQEDPLRDRPDRQELPQRDQPGQLRLPDARVRADGDAVLRGPRRPAGGRGVRGVAAPPPGVVRGVRRRRRPACASASTRPTSSPTTPRRRSTSSTASRSAGRSSRGSTTGATSTSRATPRRRARTSSTSIRRPRSTTSRGSSRPPRAPTGPRSRSSSTPIARSRSRARRGSRWPSIPTWRRTRSRSCRCSRSGPRSSSCATGSRTT